MKGQYRNLFLIVQGRFFSFMYYVDHLQDLPLKMDRLFSKKTENFVQGMLFHMPSILLILIAEYIVLLHLVVN